MTAPAAVRRRDPTALLSPGDPRPLGPQGRPIVFSEPMVLAILAGNKTQTRRKIRKGARRCPYGVAGDELWVRERWRVHHGEPARLEFLADGAARNLRSQALAQGLGPSERPRSPLFLPRGFARIRLGVIETRREALQAMTEADARAEGVGSVAEFCALWESLHGPGSWERSGEVWVVRFCVQAVTVPGKKPAGG